MNLRQGIVSVAGVSAIFAGAYFGNEAKEGFIEASPEVVDSAEGLDVILENEWMAAYLGGATVFMVEFGALTAINYRNQNRRLDESTQQAHNSFQ